MSPNKVVKQHLTNEDEEPVEIPKKKAGKGGDPATTKGTIEFYGLINEMSMNRFGTRVPASGSVVLTKTQITQKKFKQELNDNEDDNKFKEIFEEMRCKSSQDTHSNL
jgi:hypothetical protein